MNCPRCEHHPLSEIDRDGISIDRCDACRGIWLDRGELEKLTARSRTDHTDRTDRPGRGNDDDDDDDDDDDRRGRRGGGFWSLFD